MLTREIDNYLNYMNGPGKDLVLRCLDNVEEKRIRTLEQIKKHEYFQGYKWDEINTEPNTVKPSGFNK